MFCPVFLVIENIFPKENHNLLAILSKTLNKVDTVGYVLVGAALTICWCHITQHQEDLVSRSSNFFNWSHLLLLPFMASLFNLCKAWCHLSR